MNILFDIDGVLADFTQVFRRTANKLSPLGVPVWTTHEQPTWKPFDLQASQVNDVWEEIRQSPFWWAKLPPLVSPLVFSEINRLSLRHHVVFCTDRKIGSPSPQIQTVQWLKQNGIANPSVVLSKRKGEVARALDMDLAIDDKPENCACIHWISDARPTKTFVLDRLYNQHGIPDNVTRVKTVEEFLGAIH